MIHRFVCVPNKFDFWSVGFIDYILFNFFAHYFTQTILLRQLRVNIESYKRSDVSLVRPTVSTVHFQVVDSNKYTVFRKLHSLERKYLVSLV